MQHKISISLPVGFGHYYEHEHMNDECEIYVREYRSPWSYDQRYQHCEYLLFLTIVQWFLHFSYLCIVKSYDVYDLHGSDVKSPHGTSSDCVAIMFCLNLWV